MLKSYNVECFFVVLTLLLACWLGSDYLIVSLNYDYSFVVFFSCLFALFVPVWYLVAKKF